jgi:hypothetical protein
MNNPKQVVQQDKEVSHILFFTMIDKSVKDLQES